MFVKPQITSTPHLVAPMGDVVGQACGSSFGSGCSPSFSCHPYQGSDCVDTDYFDPASGFAVGAIAGVVIGGVVIVAK
jgi:hypothetical protein